MIILEGDENNVWVKKVNFSLDALKSINIGYKALTPKYQKLFEDFEQYSNLFYNDMNIVIMGYHYKMARNNCLRVKTKKALLKEFDILSLRGEICIIWYMVEVNGFLQVDYYFPKDTIIEGFINSAYRKSVITDVLNTL